MEEQALKALEVSQKNLLDAGISILFSEGMTTMFSISNETSPGPPSIIAILGPTASGKTALAIQAAKSFDGEIISLDSLQVHYHAPILTAAPSLDEQAQAPHHLVTYLAPDKEPVTYYDDFFVKLEQIQRKGKVVVVCGGSISLSGPVLREILRRNHRLSAVVLHGREDIMLERIWKRLDGMLDSGLLDEVRELWRMERDAGGDMRGKGVWKAIGYDDLRQWAGLVEQGGDEEDMKRRLDDGVRSMKEKTYRYACEQVEHLWGKLVPELHQTSTHVVPLAISSLTTELDFMNIVV